MYMDTMNKPQTLTQNDDGFASLVIALILIVVLSLLTIGFAQLARTEQQNALNKQLANQAYYAAESGVNDAIQALPAIESASPAVNPDQCLSSSILPNSTLNSNTDVSYSCVLVNLNPLSLVKDPLSADSGWSTVFSTMNPPGTTGGSNVLASLTVNWSSTDNQTALPSSAITPLPPDSSWTYPAVIQFSITPVPSGTLNRATLESSTFTAYLYPSTSGTGSVQYVTSSPNSPIVTASNCSSGTCSVTITNIDQPGNTSGEFYLIHLFDYYDSSDVAVTNATDSNGKSLEFTESQAQIDSTGKAIQAVKRIQVVWPLNSTLNLPNNAIEAQNACKRFSVYPDYVLWDGLDPSCTLN
jgi:Tfp pilus assembly protein PilX